MITHIGLAGCGNWGRFILRDLKSLGCRVTVAARSTRSRAFAAEFGADHVVPSIGELPSDADGFVVATPTALHHEAVSALLAFGRPVFVEKPLTNDLDSARDLESRAPGRIFVMDKWRYHPGVEALRDLARSQELGPVRYIQTLRLGWSNPHEVDAAWILLPHDLAITLEILGYIPDPVSAFAEYQCSSLSGMSGVLGRDPAVSVEVSAARASTLRRISVCFERGAAVLEDSYSPGDPHSPPHPQQRAQGRPRGIAAACHRASPRPRAACVCRLPARRPAAPQQCCRRRSHRRSDLRATAPGGCENFVGRSPGGEDPRSI